MPVESYVLFVIVAAVAAAIAAAVAPRHLHGGFPSALVVGVVGAWVGAALSGEHGPILAGVSLFPTIVGAGGLIWSWGMLSEAQPE